MIYKLHRNTIHLSVFLCFSILRWNKDNHSSRHEVSFQSHSTQDHTFMIHSDVWKVSSRKTFRSFLVTLVIPKGEQKFKQPYTKSFSIMSSLSLWSVLHTITLCLSAWKSYHCSKKPHVWCTIKCLICIFSRHSALVAHGQLISWGFCLPLFPNCKISVSSGNCS